jgi:hypothetical protein
LDDPKNQVIVHWVAPKILDIPLYTVENYGRNFFKSGCWDHTALWSWVRYLAVNSRIIPDNYTFQPIRCLGFETGLQF